MKSILKLATASLTVAALAAIASPVFAGPARVELSVGGGYGYVQQQAYVAPRVVYVAPAPLVRYQYEDGWRQRQWREHEWRERERREHYWRERNEWREHQWHEQFGGPGDHHQRDRDGAWR